MSDGLDQVRERIIEATDESLPSFQRVERLHAVRSDMMAAMEEVDEAIEVAEAQRYADHLPIEMAVMALRERATTTERLLAEGLLLSEEVAGAGILDHAELDRLAEEGLLEPLAQGLVDTGRVNLSGEWVSPEDPAPEPDPAAA